MAWTAFRLALRLLYRRIGILLAGNILWIVVSLPLVTLPAATGGLFYLVYRIVLEERDLDPQPAQIGDFWVGFRSYWKRSTWLVLLDLAAFILLAVTLRFYLGSPAEPLRWLAGPVILILVVWLGMQLYLFPSVIAYPEPTIRSIVQNAFMLVLSYPLYTLLLTIWLILLMAICIVLAGPVLLLLFALLALTQTIALRFIRIEREEIPAAKAKK